MKTIKASLAAVALLSSVAAAQQYVISTVAGGAPPPTPALGTSVSIGHPFGIAADTAGNVYFVSPDYLVNSEDLGCVFKLDPSGIVTRVAGNSRPGYSGDGGPATNAQLYYPTAVAADSSGNLFIADSYNHRIRQVSGSGVITTVAGNGAGGFSGDGGAATDARLYYPSGVAVDGGGNLFIRDSGNGSVRQVSPSGIITTVNTFGFASGKTGIAALDGAVDSSGNIYIADAYVPSIRKISTSGIITTVAGNGTRGFSGDGGQATNAQLNLEPFDPDFGLGDAGFVAVDGSGNVFIADSGNGRIRKVSPSGIITTVAGNGPTCCSSGDGGPASSAQLNAPSGVAADNAGNIFIADSSNHRVRKVSPSGIITTVAGNGAPGYSGDGGPATDARLHYPSGVAVDGTGNVFIADSSNHRIRLVSPNGIIITVAGNGTPGYSGDGGSATSAQLLYPSGVAADASGNVFIVGGNFRIRQVSENGIITTVAGNGTQGTFGDGGSATSAQLQYPSGVAVDGSSNLFIADGQRVRKVSHGIITTVAGTGTQGFSGDGGPATSAELGYVVSVAVDGVGNLFIADAYKPSIRKISTSGIITTVAGNGTPGYSGDGGPATSAHLSAPSGVAADNAGNIYIADPGHNSVRVLRPTNHSVLISAVVDAASERADPLAPGKIVVIYGGGLGPAQLIQNQPSNGQFSTGLAGTTVSFNGNAAPILYTSATQVAAIVPYGVTSTTAQVTVAYQGEVSAAFTAAVAPSAPSLFALNQTGSGQAAAINADGTPNTAANPAKVGGSISLYATGEGQTTPSGFDGKLGSITAHPVLPVSVTVGGIPATVQYAGGVQGQVAGLMQVNVQIPTGVKPGGYVPVVLKVGDASTTPGAVWIAVSGN
jgi:uncharacterized protein (TIGR03437 family)